MSSPAEISQGTDRHGTSFQVVTLAQRPQLAEQIDALHEHEGVWDAFLDGAPWNHWESLFDTFADLQVVLCEPDDVVIGFEHTVPSCGTALRTICPPCSTT